MWRHGVRPPEGAPGLAVPVARLHLRLCAGHCQFAVCAGRPGRAVSRHGVPRHVIGPAGFAFPEANPHVDVAHGRFFGRCRLIADRHFVVRRAPAGIVGRIFVHHQ